MIEIVTALGAIVGILALAVKLLLTDWFKKSQDLEAEKKKNSNQTQSRLEDELKVLRSIVTTMQETVRLVTSKLDRSDMRIDQLVEKLNDMEKMLDEFNQNTSDKIKNMIKTEIVEISKRAAMIRAKKDP